MGILGFVLITVVVLNAEKIEERIEDRREKRDL
jgi:hypothetical protein